MAEPEEFARRDTEVFPPAATATSAGSAPAGRREVQRVPLVAGVVFIVLAIVLVSGVDLSIGFFGDGGLVWVVLIAGGIALLVNELRRARRRRG